MDNTSETNKATETLNLTPEELKNLLAFIDEIPTKWGFPIKIFFIDIAKKREISASKNEQ